MSQKMNIKKNIGTGIPSNNKIDIQIQYTKIFGVPILKTSFPKNSIDKLVGLTDSLLKDPKQIDYSNKLAGVIKKGKQILMPVKIKETGAKDILKSLQNNIKALCNNYIESVRNSDEGSKKMWKDFTMNIIQVWLVSQYKHDYNPPHTHGGTMSGIIYLKVPKRITDNLEVPDGKLSFQGWLPYKPEMLMFNQNQSINPKTGDVYIFPAWLSHQVYPFDFDEERRCISFNLQATPLGENVKY